jgi:cytoskeletal protein RodZ
MDPESVMDIGTTLRNARERHERTLAQLASTTKIPVSILQAVEANDFGRVPRGIFVRGFLRAYAAEVGLDPNEIVGRFLRETADATVAAPDSAPADSTAIENVIVEARRDPYLESGGAGWGYLLVAATLLAAFIGINRYNANADLEPAQASAAQAYSLADATSAPLAAIAEAVATTGLTTPAAISSAAGGAATLRFDLYADAECWVEVVVDGRRVVYRLMQAGERQTIESQREIMLRVGDPGALTYRLNGAPGKPLGRAGVPVTVRFTNQGA